jgi:hypothetical protein
MCFQRGLAGYPVARTPAGAEQWRPATCKLTDEEESCSLDVYVDVGLRKTDALQSSECLHRRLSCTRSSTSILVCSIISTSGTLTPPYSFAKNCMALTSAGQVISYPVCGTADETAIKEDSGRALQLTQSPSISNLKTSIRAILS